MPSRRLVVSCATAATAILVLGGAAVTVDRTADARWREMESWATEARAAYERRDFRRPVAWGEMHAGCAFEHYRRALELAQPLVRGQDRLVQLWAQEVLRNASPKSKLLSPQEAAAIRAAWAPALAAMRHGAHCAEGGPALDLGRPILNTNLLAARWLVNLSVLDAFDVLADGDGRRAVGLLLDALTLGTDLLRSPCLIERMIGSSLVAIVVIQGCDEERLELFDREALDLLAGGLARLDDEALAASRFEEEALVSAQFLRQEQDDPESEGWTGVPTRSWRFGFSERWMIADAVLILARQTSPIGPDQPWPVRERLLQQQERAAREHPNPMVAVLWPCLSAAERSIRNVLARLRCLRLCVDHRRGVALRELSDPLGDGPLRVERTAGTVRFASVGEAGGTRIELAAPVR